MDQDGDFGPGAALGARMIAVALVSAVMTATLVIAIGHSIIERPPVATPQSQAVMIRTSG